MKATVQKVEVAQSFLNALESAIELEVLGRLKRELYWTLGDTRTHGLISRIGLSLGQKDSLEDAGDLIHPRGLATLTKKSTNISSEEHVMESTDSLEVAAYSNFFSFPSKEPQCWFLCGYLTGLLSGRSGKTIYVLETQCMSKGDSCCRFVGRPADAWDDEHELMLSTYKEDNMIHELTETREQLRITKDRYQNLFEHSSVPILIIDPNTGVLLDANIACEQLTGYTKQHLLNMTIFDLSHPNQHNYLLAGLKDVSSEGQETLGETTLVRKDGLERMLVTSSKILSIGGSPVVQRALRDVTDLKHAEQKERDLQNQLQRSERLSSIGRLAASVAHEIKNPLGAIRNAVYYIRKALDGNSLLESDPHLKDILKLSEEEVDTAVTIIEELLDYSRVVNLVTRQTSINELLESLPHIVPVPSDIELIWDLDITLPSCMVDPNRLRQVYCNVMANAIQAMPHGGKLTISSRVDVKMATDTTERVEMIAVRFDDTGVGVEPVHLGKIFEPLFTTKARGTGLGLAICSNIIEKHGGSIEVTSKVGKGTTFTIKVPLYSSYDKEAHV